MHRNLQLRLLLRRGFRSEAALNAIRAHSSENGTHLALYNYPTFGGAYAALGAHLFHSRRQLNLLVLPFSSVHPFRVEDFRFAGLETCYLLDFIGPKQFAVELSKFIPRVIAFDHRQSTLARILQLGQCPSNLELRVDTSKSSARAVFEYFSNMLEEDKSPDVEIEKLLDQEDEERVANVLRYIEDADLRRWELCETKQFQIALKDERAKLNCVTNPHVFKQLLQLDAASLISKGKLYVSSRQQAAERLVQKPFKIQLGRGLYGECLGLRADGNSSLSHEMGLELSRRSAAAGLRPIGAVVFAQRGDLKICLKSTDEATDTSEIAKAYGGGGNRSSSSLTIRMDEYNSWTGVNS